jgi:hypothetical protein
MKDAKGHGSNPRGLHSGGIDKLPGWSAVKLVPVNSLHPRPENTAMIEKFKAIDAEGEAAFHAAYPSEAYAPQPGDMRYKVDGIRQTLRSGGTVPPLAVNKDNSIEDGENRWNAYKAEGIKMVPVRVRK